MIKELQIAQRTVIALSWENQELNERNDALRKSPENLDEASRSRGGELPLPFLYHMDSFSGGVTLASPWPQQ